MKIPRREAIVYQPDARHRAVYRAYQRMLALFKDQSSIMSKGAWQCIDGASAQPMNSAPHPVDYSAEGGKLEHKSFAEQRSSQGRRRGHSSRKCGAVEVCRRPGERSRRGVNRRRSKSSQEVAGHLRQHPAKER